jgi:PAS domain S-box-containing protein
MSSQRNSKQQNDMLPDEAGQRGGQAMPGPAGGHRAAMPAAAPGEVLRVALQELEAQAKQLEQANAALSVANDRLEEKVARRTSELAAAHAALREREQHLRLIFESATDYAIFTMDLHGRVTSWNTGARRLLGWTEEEMLGRTTHDLFTPEDRARRVPEAELRRATECGRAENERWHQRKDGRRFWASGLAMPLRDEHGALHGFLTILRDRTDARREEERRELLLRELDHRVKNTLFVAQSVAAQTERTAATPAEFRVAFGGRLRALARAHDMLAQRCWEGAPLREVLQRTLKAHAAERLVLCGPEILLPPNSAVTANLAFHELATNAAKHGALSVPGGRVEVTWVAEQPGGAAAPVVAVTWRERGGPEVRPPVRRGFGSRLLERGVAREFGGEVRLDFLPDGVECHMRLPLSAPAMASQGTDPDPQARSCRDKPQPARSPAGCRGEAKAR